MVMVKSMWNLCRDHQLYTLRGYELPADAGDVLHRIVSISLSVSLYLKNNSQDSRGETRGDDTTKQHQQDPRIQGK